MSIIKDSKLAELGNEEVAWAARQMLVLEEIKNELIHAEKSKILNMYSMSHYDKVRRSILIQFFK